MTATTTQLEQTTVLLESLHSSYAALLEDAKQQLTEIDITDTAVDRICTKLKSDSTFKRTLSTNTVDELSTNILNNEPEGTPQRRLIAHIATQVGNQLGDALQVQLDAKLKEYLGSGIIETAIAAHIDNSAELQSAIATKATLKQAFALAFDLDMNEEPAKTSS